MERIGLIDISIEPRLYIAEKKGDSVELKDTRSFSCTKDYEFSIPELPEGIDEFYLGLPLSVLNFRIVELPFSDREKILSVLPFELDSIILNGVNSVILDGIILESSEGKSSVLAVYVEKAVLKKIIGRLKTFNIDPRIVTSVELNKIVKDFNPGKLLSQIDMTPEERVNTVIGEIKNNTINLRRGELSYTKSAEDVKRSLRLTATLGIIALVFFISSITLKIISIKKETSAVQEGIKRIYSEVFPEDKKATAGVYQFKARMKELKDKEEHLIGISPLNFLLNLSNINRGGITFNEITMDRGRVIFRGEAASFSDVQKVKEDLSRVLNEVNVSDSKSSAQGKVLFTITAKEKKS